MAQPRARRTLNASNDVDPFTLMADVYDKLLVLNYEVNFCVQKGFRPLSREYFALDSVPTEQFSYFSALCAWLLKDVMQLQIVEWNEFEDANSQSNSIIIEAKKLGLTKDVPLSHLRKGSGPAVCVTLQFLVSKALEAIRWTPMQPQYAAAQTVDDDVVEEDETDDIDEDVAEELEDDIADDDDDDNTAYASGKAAEPEKKTTQAVVEAQVDPAQWKLELERVGPRLKYKSTVSAKEWRTHLDQTLKHEKLLGQHVPPAQVNVQKVGDRLKKLVERLAAKERHINSSFDHLGTEFQSKQAELEELQKQYNELSSVVSELSADLQRRAEDVELVKSQMSSQNNSMTDTSPLRRVSTSLNQLRKQVAQMELRIGVVSQTLLQATLKSGRRHKGPGAVGTSDTADRLGGRTGSADYLYDEEEEEDDDDDDDEDEDSDSESAEDSDEDSELQSSDSGSDDDDEEEDDQSQRFTGGRSDEDSESAYI